MRMFLAWSSKTHDARYFTHLLHIGLLGLFPSTASLDAVCSVFHVLAASLPSQSYCFMCSKSEANATNSSEFELACGGDFARCRQPRKKQRCETFTLIAICRIWTTSRGIVFKHRWLVLCPFLSVFFVYPPALHAHFTSCTRMWKRSLLAICRSWVTLLANRFSAEASQLREIASKLRFHVFLQDVKSAWSAGGYTKNTFTKGHKTSQRFLKTVPRDAVQMRQIAIKVKVLHRLFFRGWRHRAKSPPQASSNSLLFVAFASLFEHMKQYDWEGKGAASTWNTEQTASSDAVDGNRPITKTSFSYVNSRLNYISPENHHYSKW